MYIVIRPFPAHTDKQTNKFDRSFLLKQVFSKLVFFNFKTTTMVYHRIESGCDDINERDYNLGDDLNCIYQSERRYFQYTLLQNNVRFIKVYNCNGNDNHEREYFVFKLGHLTTNSQILYAICEENDNRDRFSSNKNQAWCCSMIGTINELFEFIYSQLESKTDNFNFDYRDYNLFCQVINDETNTSINTNINTNSNTYTSLSTYTLMNCNGENKDVDTCNLKFNPYYDYNTNIKQIKRLCKRAMTGGNYKTFNSNGLNNRTGNRNVNGLTEKETKGDYLIRLEELLSTTRDKLLFVKIPQSIEMAFKFARKYPQAVLTQVFIDEEKGNICYELLLVAEISHTIKGKNGITVEEKYYKFGVPIVTRKTTIVRRAEINKTQSCTSGEITSNKQCTTTKNNNYNNCNKSNLKTTDRKKQRKKQKQRQKGKEKEKTTKLSNLKHGGGEYFYMAKNFLTPTMVSDNIELSMFDNCSKNTQNNNANLYWMKCAANDNLSFYKQIDKYWYNNNNDIC